jgi:hypothetical protein
MWALFIGTRWALFSGTSLALSWASAKKGDANELKTTTHTNKKSRIHFLLSISSSD